MRTRVRRGVGLRRFGEAPLLSIALAVGAWVEHRRAPPATQQPSLEPALPSALPVVAGTHVEREHRLEPGDEVALLIPVAGGT